MRSLSPQDAYIRLKAMQVPYESICKLFKHIKENLDEWQDAKWEMLKRCERGDMHVGGMGWVDEVRKERRDKGGKPFVLNNNWSPLYCRLFVANYPEYASRFEFRELKVKEAA